jgi:hypothetical protein
MTPTFSRSRTSLKYCTWVPPLDDQMVKRGSQKSPQIKAEKDSEGSKDRQSILLHEIILWGGFGVTKPLFSRSCQRRTDYIIDSMVGIVLEHHQNYGPD